MPRYARLHWPGALVHVIPRFVNRSFRLCGPDERLSYLRRLAKAVGGTDWRLVAYVLMSSHVHLALLAGLDEPWTWLLPLHTGMALELNDRSGGLGHIFAGRPKTIYMPPERMRALVPYQHNNPVRAGLVGEASEWSWSSHRAWIGAEPAPAFLHVEEGLRLAGFEATPEGRARFDDFVKSRRHQPRDPLLTAQSIDAARARLRRDLRQPVELASPALEGDRLKFELLQRGASEPIDALLDRVARLTGVSAVEIKSHRRTRDIVHARHVAVVAAVRELGIRRVDIADALGIAQSTVSRLLAEPLDDIELPSLRP